MYQLKTNYSPVVQLEVHQQQMWRHFRNKWDEDEPPSVSDLYSRKHKGDDKYKLAERFYQWGIKPEWLQIQRIVTHE